MIIESSRMNVYRLIHPIATLCAVGMLLFNSCKKTEYTDFEQRTLNRILQYKVTNIPQTASGAIDQVNNTITMYVPYYIGIEYLIADIKLDEGAVLLDSTGNEINLDGGLEPVAINSGEVKYTVRGADGNSRTYTLYIEIIPHPGELAVRYGSRSDDVSSLNKPVNGMFSLYGNFESTSTNAKFYLKDKSTGKIYDNFFKVVSVLPGDAQYTMTVNILPEALAGEYEVTMEHQGRTTQLRPATLYYNKPFIDWISSSAAYAPGDTISFNAITHSQFDGRSGVLIGLERIYLKLKKDLLAKVPDDFSEDYYDREIELEIVEWNRTGIKAIFPDIPAGAYTNQYSYGLGTNQAIILNSSGFGFYFDFDNQTDWGKDILLATASSVFTVNPKQ